MLARTRVAFAAAALGSATAGVLAASPAHAACTTALTGCSSSGTQTTTVTAAVDGTLGGTRTIAAVPGISLGLTNGTLSAPLAVSVVETLAPGANPWGVTVRSTDLTTTPAGGTITSNNLSVADSATVPVAGGCLALSLNPCTASGGGTSARALNSDQKLFAVSGESTGQLYTGTYAYTGTLALNVPSGTQTGAYSGTLTFTLLQ